MSMSKTDLILLLAIRHDCSNEVAALGKVVANDILAHAVQHANGPQGSMGQGGLNVAGVGRRLDAINDNVAMHGVGVVQAIRPDARHSGNLVGGTSGSGQLIASLGNRSDGQLGVDIEVVVGGEGHSAATHGRQLHKLGTSSSQLVGEHVHIAELAGSGEDLGREGGRGKILVIV